VKDLQFAVFHDKACVAEDFGHDVVTTKKEGRRQFVTLLLRNKKTVIYKRKDIRRYFFFKIIYSFLNVFIIGAMYIAEIIGERAEP